MPDREKYYNHKDQPIDSKLPSKQPQGKYLRLDKFKDGSCFYIKRVTIWQ